MTTVHVPARRRKQRPSERHLRIGEAARAVGVSPSALRLWERQQLVHPARSHSGYRLYTREDVDHLRQVRRMRDQDVNAPGIRRLLRASTSEGTHPPDASDGTGGRLRDLRRAHGLSLREASRRSGLSAGFLSSLERGTAAASLATMQRLTTIYGVTMLDLFEPTPRRERLVTSGKRRTLTLSDSGVRIEQLAAAAEMLEPQLFTLAPRATSEGAYSHAGEEFLYVLEGAVTIWVGDRERYRLRAGDALTFPSTLPHRWRNRAGGETRLLWINTPPTF